MIYPHRIMERNTFFCSTAALLWLLHFRWKANQSRWMFQILLFQPWFPANPDDFANQIFHNYFCRFIMEKYIGKKTNSFIISIYRVFYSKSCTQNSSFFRFWSKCELGWLTYLLLWRSCACSESHPGPYGGAKLSSLMQTVNISIFSFPPLLLCLEGFWYMHACKQNHSGKKVR